MHVAPSCSALQVAFQKASEFYEEANAANDAHAVHFIGRCLSQKVTLENRSALVLAFSEIHITSHPVPTALTHAFDCGAERLHPPG